MLSWFKNLFNWLFFEETSVETQASNEIKLLLLAFTKDMQEMAEYANHDGFRCKNIAELESVTKDVLAYMTDIEFRVAKNTDEECVLEFKIMTKTDKVFPPAFETLITSIRYKINKKEKVFDLPTLITCVQTELKNRSFRTVKYIDKDEQPDLSGCKWVHTK